MIPLTNYDFQWARSELVIIYPGKSVELPNVMQWQQFFELWEHCVMIAAMTTANHQT